MEDIRYSEFLFLQALSNRTLDWIHSSNTTLAERFKIAPQFFFGMIATLLEDMYVSFDNAIYQELIWKLRGEHKIDKPLDFQDYEWNRPRATIESILQGRASYQLHLTYRGLRRIEELRDVLKRDRILEDFGILLSMRYFLPDLQDALSRSTDLHISVIRADMDDFGKINKEFSYAAGNEVMKAYLLAVHNAVDNFGTAYRGSGDEMASIIVGQGHQEALKIAENIRNQVRSIKIEYKGQSLPRVTASIGVATSPPGPRSLDLDTLADDAALKAKDGKDRVVEA